MLQPNDIVQVIVSGGGRFETNYHSDKIRILKFSSETSGVINAQTNSHDYRILLRPTFVMTPETIPSDTEVRIQA
jgi:hypothetical protein